MSKFDYLQMKPVMFTFCGSLLEIPDPF